MTHRVCVGCALGLILIVGGYLRFENLANRSIRFDEAWSWSVGQSESAGGVLRAAQQDFNPPLYWWVLRQWMRWFGDSEFAMRSLSATCGIVSVLFMFWLGTEVAGVENLSQSTLCGLVAAALLSVSSVHVLWAQQVRMYALASCLTCLLYTSPSPRDRTRSRMPSSA